MCQLDLSLIAPVQLSLVDALHINSNYSKVLTGLNPYLVCYVFSLEVPISCVIEEDEGPKL